MTILKNVQIEVLSTKTEYPTLKINDYLIHSKYNPMHEASQIAKSESLANHTHILFGAGHGYLMRALKENLKENAKLITYDPIANELDEYLGEDSEFVFGPSHFKDFERNLVNLLTETNNRVKLICTPHYKDIFPNEYKRFLESLKLMMSGVNNSVHTVVSTSKEWQKNLLNNLYYFFQDKTVLHLKNAFNKPIVIASGGPSLSKQLELVKKVRENIILIASGSTVNSLLGEEIEPDFVVSVDGRDSHFDAHYKNIKIKKAVLLYGMESNYQIREKFPSGSSFFTELDSHMDYFLKRRFSIEAATIIGGTSCANFAFSIATFISSHPIAFIGQDLAFTNNSTHAKNNNDFKELTDEVIKKNKYFETTGYYGEPILTSQLMFDMKRSFERQLLSIKHRSNIFNCTEGGLSIDGMKQIPFSQFVEEFVDVEDSLSLEDYDFTSSTNINFETYLQQDFQLYDESKKLVEQALEIAIKAREKGAYSEKQLKRLEKLDKKIGNILAMLPIWRLLSTIKMQLDNIHLIKENETDEELFNRVANHSIDLYEAFLLVIDISRGYTEELYKKIQEDLNDE